ncbi:restriction endonuclease subunit S [Candidatus Palauibacter sp.]|uniref:restriction endonuclease subunit S n=1 Tax=Candidatus Palauibacter sp. TaxID=3101350 RepID=UPI003AF20905
MSENRAAPPPSAPRFERYREYRESGVGWLGEIPAHWEAKRTKFAATLRSGHTPSRQKAEYWQDCTIPWFSLADVWQVRDGRVEYVHETAEKISEIGLANSSARLLPEGTVVLSRTASVGFSAILGGDMATTQDFVNWVCGPSLRPEYLLYVFRAMGPEFRRLTMGSTHQTIYMHDVGGFSTPVPPVPEQDQIVAFVRKEIGRIDALVANQERLINLLREKRTALISDAVTRGLDPDAPMWDSGHEWLGDVPEGWKVLPLKRLALIRYGLGEPPPELSDGLPLIRATDISNGRIAASGIRRIDPKQIPRDREVRLEADDIIVVRSGAYTGDSAIVPKALEHAIAGYDMFMRVRNAAPKFIAWALLSRPVLNSQIDLMRARAAQPHLNAEELASVMIAVPPLDQQAAIVLFLDRSVARIEEAVAKVDEAIGQLREYRTALISAAVTGKIDVRNHRDGRTVTDLGQPGLML